MIVSLPADNETVETLRSAAASARCRDANDVAATYLRRALREPPAPELEPQLLHELGSVELRAGEFGSAIEHLTVALEQTTAVPQRALIALELANALPLADRIPDAVEVLSDALDQLSGGEPELRATLAAVRASLSYGSLTARQRLLARSDTPAPVAVTQTTGGRLLLGSQAVEETFTGKATQARAWALRALGEQSLLEATGPDYVPFSLPLIALIWSHAFEDAERHLQAALADACRRGSESGFAVTSHWRAVLSWRRGALGELEADPRAPLCWRPDALAELEATPRAPLGSMVGIAGFPLAAVALAEALIERGDPAAAMDELRAAGLDAAAPTAFAAPLAVEARAHVKLAQRRPDEALALLHECGRLEEAWGVVTPSLTSWRAEAAVLRAWLGDADRARSLAGEAVRRADEFGSPVARGIALRAAALVERPPDNDRLAASVAVLRGSGAQLELARSLVELGSALRRSRHRADAREPLREGLELAVGCGADALATRAHDESIAAGARPRRDPIESRSTLTASELRVARLAAEGMTNKEAAQALFLTAKTIEVHLTRVYRKLGIQSRSQLRRALPQEAVAA
jgi:DNA-binding CsgD family transcriptional regulator